MTEQQGDGEVLSRISALVQEEHHLSTEGGTAAEHVARRNQLEVELDQCWDLLRQRQARRDAGADPAGAHARPVGEVEGYLQ